MHWTASELDARDELAGWAAQFTKPAGQIYLDGNSLGLACQHALDSLEQAIETWRRLAIRGWTEGRQSWFEMSRQAAALLAEILGAESNDLMVGQSTTVNLHQLLATFYQPDGAHPRILIDSLSFPTDRYAVESHLRLRGCDAASHLVVLTIDDDDLIDANHICDAMDATVGLAVLPSVFYRSGQLLDLAHITRLARDRGVVVIWDCSHSAGVVPHHFRDNDIDLAFGCTYKYLNGGPGSVGYLYIHPRWRDRRPGMAGWFGCDPVRQFAMEPDFHPASDAGRYLLGTPHVLSLAPLLGSLRLILDVGVTRLRQKSLLLTEFLRQEVEGRLAAFQVRVVTPREDHRRGGHITIKHAHAGRISRALRAKGVIPDYRPPNLLRLAPSPLYTSFSECQLAVDMLEDILISHSYEHLSEHDEAVT